MYGWWSLKFALFRIKKTFVWQNKMETTELEEPTAKTYFHVQEA